MKCVNLYQSTAAQVTNTIHGSCCVSPVNGSHIAVTVKNTSLVSPFPFKVYLDEWHTGSGYSGWVEKGWRTGTTSASGTNVSFSPNTYGATKTYRVRCHIFPDLSDKFIYTAGNISYKS